MKKESQEQKELQININLAEYKEEIQTFLKQVTEKIFVNF